MQIRTVWDELARNPYLWAVGAFMFLYRVFLWWCYWNWFVTPTFKIPSLNYLHAMGLVLFVDIFSPSDEEPAHARRRWEITNEGLELLMTEEQVKKWTTVTKEIIQDNLHGPGYTKWKLFEGIAGKFFGFTFMLILGFLIKLGAEKL